MTNRLPQEIQYCLAGHLLVAAPAWEHPFYGRSVCLVVHHSPDQAVGIFLNRQLPVTADGLWKQLSGGQAVATRPTLNFGGPHSGPIIALHDQIQLSEHACAEGVYCTAQLENLKTLVKTPSQMHFKLIVGQTEWGTGELDQQFAAGKWLPLPISPSLVFEEAEYLWHRALRTVGNSLVASMTGVSGLPSSVLAN
ncbi:YqgE/AlgH family protein [Aureliella helgolandensis]|uniref:Uncharacterized protein n=1 Tax=Aureliella helgolandensis TaxID=2527968 RepID=A0A518GFI5_9BACT|nr:YqgE/AlgH family protein [Aureliella helgolandensis]QDV27354.1 hypothetical protein Q31a_57420 [Aureliella helgolandensis]